MQPKTHFTVEEYLAMEMVSTTRNEYWDGVIVPVHQEVWGMAGASPRHLEIVAELIVQLRTRLRDRCKAVASDQRISIGGTKYVYPDIVVYCDAPEYTAENPPALCNPALLIEVTSGSTEDIDSSIKRDAYLSIPSLLEYWVVKQDAPAITRFIRDSDTEWLLRIEGGTGTVLRSEHLGIEIPIEAIYPA